MKRLGIFCCLIVALAFANAACADEPVGHYEIDFSGDLAVWDVTGSYDEYVGDFHMVLDVAMDEDGKIEGAGYADANIYGYQIHMDFTISGSVKTSGAITKVTLKMRYTGTLDGYNFKGTATVKAEIDANSQTLTGSIKITVKAGGYRESIREACDFDLDATMTGAWTLETDTNDVDGKNFVGTGTVTLSNGDTYQFTVSGKYNIKKDLSKITVRGASWELRKNKATLTQVQTGAPECLDGRLKCKLLGQKRKGYF